jgi:hypothetical protein
VVYPFLGVGLGVTQLSISMPSEPTQFDDALRAPAENRAGFLTLESYSSVLHAGVATAIWGSGHGDFIGLRGGFVAAPGDRGWKDIGNAVTGGPRPPLTGAYLVATLGWHTPGSRRGLRITPFVRATNHSDAGTGSFGIRQVQSPAPSQNDMAPGQSLSGSTPAGKKEQKPGAFPLHEMQVPGHAAAPQQTSSTQ